MLVQWFSKAWVYSITVIIVSIFFQLGTDNYDNSEKVRIPSYTDRILFKSKRKHGIVCHKYDSAAQLKSSDHKPVYGLYQVSDSNKGVRYTVNVGPAFFYTKPFTYNYVAICLIMIKL